MTDVLKAADELLERANAFKQDGKMEIVMPPDAYDMALPRLKIYGEYEQILPAVLTEARRLEAKVDEVTASGIRAVEQALQIASNKAKEAAKWRRIAIEERYAMLCCQEYEPPRTEADLREQAARELETEASEWIKLTPERREALMNCIILCEELDGAIQKNDVIISIDDRLPKTLREMLAEAGE